MCLASGCGFFTSLDGFSGGDGEAADAAVVGMDASDASTHGDADAHASIEDAGNDAPPPGSRFCERIDAGELFCDDFDDATLDAWNDPGTQMAVTFKVDGKASISPPLSLSIDVGPTAKRACLTREFDGMRATLDVEFDVRIDTALSGAFKLFSVRRAVGTAYRVGVVVNAGLSSIIGSTGVDQTTTLLATRPTGFFHLAVHLGPGATPSTTTATYRINGDTVGNVATDPSIHQGTIRLELGDCELPGQGTIAALRVDNVVLR